MVFISKPNWFKTYRKDKMVVKLVRPPKEKSVEYSQRFKQTNTTSLFNRLYTSEVPIFSGFGARKYPTVKKLIRDLVRQYIASQNPDIFVNIMGQNHDNNAED